MSETSLALAQSLELANSSRLCFMSAGVLELIKSCSGKVVAIDTETNGLVWYRNYVIGFGIYCENPAVWMYVPILSDADMEALQDALGTWDPSTVVIMHNAKFDLHMLGMNPNVTQWNIRDTTVMVHLYDSRLRKSLDACEQYFLGTASKRKHVTSAPNKKVWTWSLETQADYCCNDCLVTHQLYRAMIPLLEEMGLLRVFAKEMKYIPVTWEAERYGFLVDVDYIDRSYEHQEQTLAELEQNLFDSIGYEFNWKSTKQLSRALYEGLGIPKPKNPFANEFGVDNSRFADSGLYKSTCTATFLLTEKTHHPLGTLVGALRESSKMMATMKGYKELVDSNGRIHGSFNHTGTRTGRLSCSKPNLQNVPSQVRGRFTQSVYSGSTIRTEEYNLRKAFVARPGYELLSVDWKQMEMRMFGLLAQDDLMLSFLGSGKDVHAEVAQRVWGIVDKTHREWSKTIGFGLIYGMTIGSLMHKLNQTASQAAKIRDQYLAEFPRIMPFMNEVIEKCMAFGYIRYWDDRIWREENPRDMFKGANAMIQGGCAEVLSIAAIRLSKWCKQQGSSHKIVSFVHDELMVEVPKEDVERSAREIMDIMEVRDLFPLPFYNDAKSGPTYGDQQKLFAPPEYMKPASEEVIDLIATDIDDDDVDDYDFESETDDINDDESEE